MSRSSLFCVFALFCMLLVAPATAMAEMKLAVVNFDLALSQIDEGATAMARFEGMREEKMRSMERKRQELQTMQAEIQNQAAILSEAALQAKQQEFYQKGSAFEQEAMMAQQELEVSYMQMLEEFVTKLSAVAEEIGKERGYNMVMEVSQSGIVYHDGVDDITDELVTRYNTRHAIK
jgi:outer membrane protein